MTTSKRSQRPFIPVAFWTLVLASTAHAEPTLTGQSGYINMPSARIEPEGTWTLGYSRASPYTELYSNLALFPFLELTLVGSRIMGVPGFGPAYKSYGDYKDKRFDIKLRLWDEAPLLPAVAVGMQDFYGTRLFGAEYVVASKRWGLVDFSLGYARPTLTKAGSSNVGVDPKLNRLSGVFAGARVKLHEDSPFSFVLEKDARHYRTDPFVDRTHVDQHRGKVNAGVEYQWQWLGAQVSRLGDTWGANLYVRIPLERPEFIPKVEEPEPDFLPPSAPDACTVAKRRELPA